MLSSSRLLLLLPLVGPRSTLLLPRAPHLPVLPFASSTARLRHLGAPPPNPPVSARFSSHGSGGDGADKHTTDASAKSASLESGLYLVATPIGNLEDITLRALRILRSANVILTEDTRHSWKLLQHYDIHTPLFSYHKFNESQRETTILRRLHEGQIVALISDAGTPGISDPGMELAKKCVSENICVIPVPGPSAFVAALSASGLPTNEFTFVGFLPKRTTSRKEKMLISAKQSMTQIFYVPPHDLHQFLEEASSIFGNERHCVIARELTKVHEQFWRGTLDEAKKTFQDNWVKGEITLLIKGQAGRVIEPSEAEVESELEQFLSNGHSLSRGGSNLGPPLPRINDPPLFYAPLGKPIKLWHAFTMAVKLVSEGMSVKKNRVYALALRKFRGKVDPVDAS